VSVCQKVYSTNPLRYLVEPEIDHLLAKIDAIGVVKDSFVAVQATPDSKHFRLAFTTSGIAGFSSAEQPYTRIELTPIHYPDHMGMDVMTAYRLVQKFGGTKLSNVPPYLASLLLTGLTTTTAGGIAGYVSRGSSEDAMRGAGLGFGLGMLLGATGCAQITVEALARSERRELAYEFLPTIEVVITHISGLMKKVMWEGLDCGLRQRSDGLPNGTQPRSKRYGPSRSVFNPNLPPNFRSHRTARAGQCFIR
jgi:hypothetical protein